MGMAWKYSLILTSYSVYLSKAYKFFTILTKNKNSYLIHADSVLPCENNLAFGALNMKKIVAAICLMASLVACSSEEMPPVAANHVLPPKMALDVKTISLADRSGIQPANSPYNTNHFSPKISDAIKQWATDRLQANGQSGQAIVIIKDASLKAQPIAVKEDFFDNLFTRQQGVKYIGHAEVSIEANGRSGYAMTNASATRILTLPENPTDIEKQDAYYSMLTPLMKDLGENLEAGIQAHMASFITAAPASMSYSAPRGNVQSTVGQDMMAPEAPSSFNTAPSTVEPALAPTR